MISTRNARIIRAGVNSKCIPYVMDGDESRGYCSVVDFVRLREFTVEWERFIRHPLAREAAGRTHRFTVSRVL